MLMSPSLCSVCSLRKPVTVTEQTVREGLRTKLKNQVREQYTVHIWANSVTVYLYATYLHYTPADYRR